MILFLPVFIYLLHSGDYADYGTMLEINDIKFFPDGRSVVDTVGGRRFRVLEKGMREGYHIAKVEFLNEVRVEEAELEGNTVTEWTSSYQLKLSSC